MKRLLTYYNFLRRTGSALKQHWKCLREPGRSVGFGSCCSYRAGLTWIPIKQRVCVCGWSLSHVKLFMVSWTEANQGPLPRISSQEYWNGLPCPVPGHLPDLEIKLVSPVFPTSIGGFFTTWATWEALLWG